MPGGVRPTRRSEASSNGTLYALDARAGRTKWSTGSDLTGAPVVSRGIVFATGEYGLNAFNARTGAELWSYGRPGIVTSPVAAGGDVYIGDHYGESLLGLDARTGKEVWSYSGAGQPIDPVIVSKGTIYFDGNSPAPGSFDFKVVALNAKSGTVVWGPVSGPGLIVLQDGVLYASGLHEVPPMNGNGVVFHQESFALDAAAGALTWADINPNVDPDPPFDLTAPAVVEDSVIFTGAPGSGSTTSVFALDRASGKPLWTGSIGADGGIGYQRIFYALQNGDTLAALNPNTGSTYWTLPSQSLPVFDGDVAYVEGDDGSVYALNATFGGILARTPSGSFFPLTATHGVRFTPSAPAICTHSLYRTVTS